MGKKIDPGRARLGKKINQLVVYTSLQVLGKSQTYFMYISRKSQADVCPECFFLKICLMPGNFHANLSPKLKQHISVNDGAYSIICCHTLNL